MPFAKHPRRGAPFGERQTDTPINRLYQGEVLTKTPLPSPQPPFGAGGERPRPPSTQTLTWKTVTGINRSAPFPHRPLVGFGKGGGEVPSHASASCPIDRGQPLHSINVGSNHQ